MIPLRPTHITATCLVKDLELTLDNLSSDYDLIAMSSHQVGSGFGAFVEVITVFRLRPAKAETNGKSNGVHPGQRGPGAFAKKRA